MRVIHENEVWQYNYNGIVTSLKTGITKRALKRTVKRDGVIWELIIFDDDE